MDVWDVGNCVFTTISILVLEPTQSYPVVNNLSFLRNTGSQYIDLHHSQASSAKVNNAWSSLEYLFTVEKSSYRE